MELNELEIMEMTTKKLTQKDILEMARKTALNDWGLWYEALEKYPDNKRIKREQERRWQILMEVETLLQQEG